MTGLLVALAILAGSGLLAVAARRTPRLGTALGACGAILGSAVGLVPALEVVTGSPAVSLSLPWAVPYGSFSVELDALSAWFVVPVLVLTALAALYGAEYLRPHQGQKSLGPTWLFYNLLTASMVLVLVAQSAVLFLVAWEVMALTSFFLVTFEDEKPAVRTAGWTYLVATHLGTAFLLVLFILLGKQTGGRLDFADWAARVPDRASADLAFLLALVGFGTKAGFVPLHVWLPEAHPAAPSHVSAVLSGVMIKTGIYGLVRTLTWLGSPPPWWAWALIGIGLTSGVLGVLFALAQHDLKRLLAYHSVENIGIIALGLGLGLLGLSGGMPALAVLGFAGGLLHVVNHALFKGLLFLGAGAVAHATGTREIDELGGLLRALPWTAAAFLTGAVAITGLPPLNGFISEFLIYLAALKGGLTASSATALPAVAVLAGLTLIGGLAAACFAKAFGIVFLGEPRSAHAQHVHAPGWRMHAAMLLLAAGCVLMAAASPILVPALAPVVREAAGLSVGGTPPALQDAVGPLTGILLASAALLGLVLGLALFRARLLRGRSVTAAGTWDCGYARPTPRMQYTASSFAQPLTALFAPLLRTRQTQPVLTEYFPREAALATETPEPWREGLYRPIFQALGWGLARLRWLQHGRVQLYVLYIALTLLVLLIWYLGGAL
jgi:formate hydrogenlyase subunit 3/multisubunit Na+/H+ antiporter MnhD subunit